MTRGDASGTGCSRGGLSPVPLASAGCSGRVARALRIAALTWALAGGAGEDGDAARWCWQAWERAVAPPCVLMASSSALAPPPASHCDRAVAVC